ncbi:hypothetical protein, partial [Brevibacillus panacihumi]|uniref:hypothetical protein n=1 Tax=Brevibacillus panacihumi TaxID=497735 RepID=UPI003D25698C
GALAAEIVFRLFRCAWVKIPNAFCFFSLFPRPAFPGPPPILCGYLMRTFKDIKNRETLVSLFDPSNL